MKYNTDTFIQNLNSINIKINDFQISQFLKYYEILVEKNRVMNLTAITEYDDVLLKHFIDSLLCVNVENMNNVNDLIDVGTGAGFPGIPIKIVFPHINITLMDSLNKRVSWLNEVVNELKLDKIECIHSRAEDLGHNTKYREKYDICVSRAVANLSTLAEYCLPFVKVGGKFLSYKGDNVEQEIETANNGIKLLSSSIVNTLNTVLPNTNIKRSIVVIRKEKCLQNKYPRKSGIPGKQPL